MKYLTKTLLNLDTSAKNLRKIARDLDAFGVVCIEHALPPATLAGRRAQLKSYLASQCQRYFSIIEPWKNTDSTYTSLARDEEFRELLTGLTTLGKLGNMCKSNIYNVLRVIADPT